MEATSSVKLDGRHDSFARLNVGLYSSWKIGAPRHLKDVYEMTCTLLCTKYKRLGQLGR
jgi:hypothetical protein